MSAAPESVEISREESAPTRWWPQLAALLLILVELGWVVPWYQLVGGLSTPQPFWKIVLVLGGVMASAYAVSLAVDSLHLIRKARLTVLNTLLVIELIIANVLLLGGFPVGSRDNALYVDPGFLSTIIFTIWLWWRGIGLGSELVRPKLAWNRFQVGLIGLIAHTFIAVNLGLPSAGVGAYIAYLFIGLLAVVLSRISYVSLTRSARKNPFDRRWMIVAAAGLGVTLIIAAGAAGLMTGQFRSILDALRAGLQWLIIIVLFLLSLPAILLSYIFLPLAPILERYIQQFFEQQQQPLDTPYPFTPYPFFEETAQPTLTVEVQMVCFWLTLAVILILVLLRMRQAYQQQGVLVVEGPESLLGEGDARRLAKRAFQDFLDGLFDRFRLQSFVLPPEKIRRIYVQLLKLSEAHGHPRPENRTPLEFLLELGQIFSETKNEVGEITNAYLDVRYGKKPEEPDEIESAEKAFSRVQSAYGEKPGQKKPPSDRTNKSVQIG